MDNESDSLERDSSIEVDGSTVHVRVSGRAMDENARDELMEALTALSGRVRRMRRRLDELEQAHESLRPALLEDCRRQPAVLERIANMLEARELRECDFRALGYGGGEWPGDGAAAYDARMRPLLSIQEQVAASPNSATERAGGEAASAELREALRSWRKGWMNDVADGGPIPTRDYELFATVGRVLGLDGGTP